MNDDTTHPDAPRLDPPGRDNGVGEMHEDLRHSLSLDQVGNIYAERGFPRSARSLQRFCANEHLDCQKVATTTGDKYLVAPYSVERHLKQLAQLQATEAATGLAVARQVATPVGQTDESHVAGDERRQDVRQAPTGDDVSEPVGNEGRDTSQLVAQLEKRISDKEDEVTFLRGEIATKNKQLADASERDRETNILIQGLQSMVLQLTGNDRPAALSQRVSASDGSAGERTWPTRIPERHSDRKPAEHGTGTPEVPERPAVDGNSHAPRL